MQLSAIFTVEFISKECAENNDVTIKPMNTKHLLSTPHLPMQASITKTNKNSLHGCKRVDK